MANRIPLVIAGFNLTVNTEEDREYVEALAKTLEKDMLALMDGPANATGSKAAVVCALDYCDKLRKANGSAINMRNQIRDYLADAANAKLIIDEREKTIEKLSHQLAESTPSDRLSEMSERLAAEKEKNTLLYRELDQLTAELDEARHAAPKSDDTAADRIAELEAQIQEASDDLADMAEDSRQLRDQNALLSSQKEALLARAAAAEEQSELLRRQLETLEQMIEEEGGNPEPLPEQDIVEDLEQSRPVHPASSDPNLPDLNWTNEVL